MIACIERFIFKITKPDSDCAYLDFIVCVTGAGSGVLLV